MPDLVVDVGRQMDGATFRLSPQTRAHLATRKLGNPLASSLYVTFPAKGALENQDGRLWAPIVMLLTGLSEDQIEDLGGFRFVDPADTEVLFESGGDR